VKGAAELRNLIGMARVGDRIEVALIREGRARKVTAFITEQSELSGEASGLHAALAGAELGDAPPGQVPGGGVLVRSVAPGSAAANVGLRANDVIVGVDRTRVAGVAALKEAIGEKGSFLLTLRRGGQTVILPVR
jgi:S1-C subfamily serine protease